MDPLSKELVRPIVVTKPKRGREMESTIVPKELPGTIMAKTVDLSQEPGEMEVFHEGYVNGKLYLVPDSNLEAMRDIVNLKMRRKHSSAVKPKTVLNEPTQFTEFTNKLDMLMKKVDNLGEKSGSSSSTLEESSSELSDGDKLSQDSAEENAKPVKRKKKSGKGKFKDRKSVLEQASRRTQSIVDRRLPTIKENDEPNRSVRFIEDDAKHEDEPADDGMVPPILDDKISYIKVRASDTPQTGEIYSPDAEERSTGFAKVNPYGQALQTPFSVHRMESQGVETESIRLMISGHLRDGKTPIFILHQDFQHVNIFSEKDMEFKQFKHEGNIDIIISGKFFTESILTEASPDSPAILNLNGYKIPINKKSALHSKEFKDIYDLGHLDVVLEGQFMKDNLTLQYTPILTMEIVKKFNDLESFSNYVDKGPSDLKSFETTDQTVMRSSVQERAPFVNTEHTDKNKHVHYTSDKDRVLPDIEDFVHTADQKAKGIMKKLRKLFTRQKIQTADSNKGIYKSPSDPLRQKLTKCRKEPASSRRRSRLQEKKSKQESTLRLSSKPSPKRAGEGKAQDTFSSPPSASRAKSSEPDYDIFRTDEGTSSPFVGKKSLEKESDGEEKSRNSISSAKPKRKKKTKEDKNQAIVENPILAQMQQFFIAV